MTAAGETAVIVARVVLRVVVVAALLVVVACRGPQQIEAVELGHSDNHSRLVSMVAVLADPASFVGQKVRLQGVLNIEFEGNQLCFDRASLESFATMNCLRLGLGQQLTSQEPELARWNGHYVTVEGTIEATRLGDHYPARIREVAHVLVIRTRRRI